MRITVVSIIIWFLFVNFGWAQSFTGKVVDQSNNPVSGVKVYVLDDEKSVFTDEAGMWLYESASKASKTFVFSKQGFAYEQLVNQEASDNNEVVLRTAINSYATIREKEYVENGCSSVNIPNDPAWDISFKVTELKGDLAPDSKYTRRDPSAVILVDGVYYVWYSYSLTHDENKIAPWDLNDLYYSTSTDGIYWEEQGLAVGRGEEGAFDHQSVFTTEILHHNGMFYLVYQAAADIDGIYNRNTVGMATASSPNGPWTKLEEPVLRPTYTDELFFDNNAVHDPCIVPYNNKFYLYYKGECNCLDNNGCVRWCNPICNLNKQVKWGVAISDHPTGPFVKSSSNPVTNTGHEVMVWPYKSGMAILQHQDGPEANSIQYSEDGFNFSIMGTVENFPEAAGLYRSEKSDTNPHQGVSWGLGHQLKWNDGPHGWMYIYRFDNENKVGVESELNNNSKLQIKALAGKVSISGLSGDYTVSIYSETGVKQYEAKHNDKTLIDVSSFNSGLYIVEVKQGDIKEVNKIIIN